MGMFDEIIEKAEKAVVNMEKKVDIRMGTIEKKIDNISADLDEIKVMIEKFE